MTSSASDQSPTSPETADAETPPVEEAAAPVAEPASGIPADAAPAPDEAPAAIETPAAEPASEPAAAADPAPAAPRAPRPAPRPGPRPGARPGPRPGSATAKAATAAAAPAVPRPASSVATAADWGRVDADGTVFVKTADGERSVGQWPGGDPAEALAHYARKYDDLVFEVDLLEHRLTSGSVSPDDAQQAVAQVRGTVTDAAVVGDLAALETRLAGFDTLIAEQRERRKKERAERVAAATAAKERIAAEAEALAGGSDWRNGADRLRVLLDEWRTVPRLDKASDDALWRRFSTARTTYTRRRKAHFAELNEKRDGARVIKEKLVKEAEALANSTDWGPTSGAFRDLMRRWKEAGPAPKGVDDQLWRKFRAAQDTFFGARDADAAATDAEFAANAEVKEGLLVQAEALLPITDLAAAKAAFRDIAEKWDAAGKVPRDRIKELEGRIRKVENAIREREDDAWRRSNPEARARAADTVAQLEASIADLEKKRAAAEAAGNTKKAAEHAAAAEARQAWLVEARKALDEFTA